MSDNPTFIGIAPHHWPALQAVVLLGVAGWLARRFVCRHAARGADWALAISGRWDRAPIPVRWAAVLLMVTAVVHLALPLGHNDSALLTVLFMGSGAAYALLAVRAVAGRRWRAVAALLMIATIAAYLVVVGRGDKEADQVGLATALVELMVLGLCLTGPLGPKRTVRRVLLRPLACATFVLTVGLSGVAVWAISANQHDSMHAHGDHDDHGDHGEFLGRAQAGFIIRPAGPPPSEQQRRAAAELVERTKVATAKYRDLRVAVADGYKSGGPTTGFDLHYDKSEYDEDGRILDPQAPETLVYAVQHGRAVLLGVMFSTGSAAVRGPAVGGSLTHWHAHNLCVTPLPLGFGVQSPYGTCPFGAWALTTGEMIHVWTVDPPGGPFAGHVDEAWVRGLLAREGRPV